MSPKSLFVYRAVWTCSDGSTYRSLPKAKTPAFKLAQSAAMSGKNNVHIEVNRADRSIMQILHIASGHLTNRN